MKQSNLKKLLKKQQELDHSFAVELGFHLNYSIEYNSDKWYYEEPSVTWFAPDDTEYSEEARIVSEKEDMTVLLVYSCTGDKYYAAFDNNKRITE